MQSLFRSLRTPLSAAAKHGGSPLVHARFMSTAFYPNIDSSKLVINKTTSPKQKLPKDQLVFGKTFSDHMLEVDFDAEKGWTAPRISPYGNFQMNPAASVLHYGIECFEGMKAYVDKSGNVRLFRPMMNMNRMNNSCARLELPRFDGAQFLDCIRELVRVDKDWIPKDHGYSLYLRPTAISTMPFLGVCPSTQAKLYCIMSPVGPYYKSGFAPVKLYADPKNVRAWPGGTGNVKCGGNYAMTLHAQREAAEKGYAQVLWLFGDEVTEVGTMNQFFFWEKPEGGRELVTAPLDGTILPGVTRDSILSLARTWGEFDVVERKYTIQEVISAVEQGRMIEAFGSGTAAIVSPVEGIAYNGKEYAIPLDASNPDAKIGKLTQRFADTIMDIQYGDVEHEWSEII